MSYTIISTGTNRVYKSAGSLNNTGMSNERQKIVVLSIALGKALDEIPGFRDIYAKVLGDWALMSDEERRAEELKVLGIEEDRGHWEQAARLKSGLNGLQDQPLIPQPQINYGSGSYYTVGGTSQPSDYIHGITRTNGSQEK